MTLAALAKTWRRISVGRIISRARAFRRNGPHGERSVIVGEKSGLPEAGENLRRDAGRGVARLSDGALPAGYAAVSAASRSTTPISRSTARCWAARPSSWTARRAACSCSTTRWARRWASSMSRKYFPPEAKAKAELLVQQSAQGLCRRHQDARLDDAGDAAEGAGEARRLSRRKIGYPDHLARLFGAGDRARRSDRRREERRRCSNGNRELARIDGPVDRTEWGMTPPTNNAYYNPDAQRDRVPGRHPAAALLRSERRRRGELWRDRRHHRPRDQPRLRRPGLANTTATACCSDWWTADDRKNFDARTAALAKQYDAYEPLPGLHINGKLTLGENIADLAGLVIALQGLSHRAGRQAGAGARRLHRRPALLSSPMRQSWREKDRDGRCARRLLSNPHSPASYRVNGVVRNDDGWYAAFEDQAGRQVLPGAGQAGEVVVTFM